ncbi:histidine--tRNA ligase [Candidatus Woesearchaeota archaeon]|nr:histidine--tRNA ligase [Candidatus Woesearchaeota archaeon]
MEDGIMELMNARGTRDFAPEEKIVRQRLTDRLRKVFELYGFSPLETPVIERYDVLAAKYAGGAEILKETFQFRDQGDRELCLRYDLTVPLARFVGMNPTMKMPFKRYAIGQVYRDGPVKTGRMREFWQCDVDIVGSKSMLADAQCLQIALKFFTELGVEFRIELNSRKILDGMMEQAGVAQDLWMPAILEIDKLKKTSLESVQKELGKLGLGAPAIQVITRIITARGTNKEKLEKLRELIGNDTGVSGLNEVDEILKYVNDERVVFSPALSRGLSYYTGPVFEVYLSDTAKFGSSMAAGGRWDKMIGDFLGNNKEYPAVGISFGLEPITTVLQMLGKESSGAKTTATVYVIPIQTVPESASLCEKLRSLGVNTDMDIMGRGVSKNLDYADKMGIPYVLIVGGDELKQGKFKLKNMKSGEEKMVSVEEVSAITGRK